MALPGKKRGKTLRKPKIKSKKQEVISFFGAINGIFQ
jgi:hypothetical protein